MQRRSEPVSRLLQVVHPGPDGYAQIYPRKTIRMPDGDTFMTVAPESD
jgi:hypothetical protein